MIRRNMNRLIRGAGHAVAAHRRTIATAALAVGVLAQPAAAQTWPVRPVRIVVPYATGGGSDVIARQIGMRLQTVWGQGVVVDNKAGASGNIGTLEVVRAPADGYTLLLQNVSMVINQAVTDKRSYEPLTDLTPIMLVGATPLALAAHPGTGVNNVKELVAKVKASKASDLNYASCGIGTPQHLTMEMLKFKASLAIEHVGYKGCAPALTDLVGGQIPYGVFSANIIVPYVRTGKLLPVGISTASRYAQLPEVPTFEEQGFAPFDFTSWYALMGPARMPPDVVAKIRADVDQILADPAVKKSLSESGIEEKRGDAAALTELIRSEQVRYKQVVREANIKSE